MYQLLNDIMNYSRLQKNDETADKILVDTNNAVNQAVLNLKTEIEKNEAQIQVVNQLPKVRGNETQMVQLFQNLISNAIKFRNGKAPNIKIDCQVLNNNYTFVVEDNGIGIPAAYHDKVFEVFKQANNQHTHKGHGIGLSICNNIVQQMDGKMWLHSKEGKGTKFYFSLPEQQSSN